MTITSDISKADLIVAIICALRDAKRMEEIGPFCRLADHARDAQEVLAIVPDDIAIEVSQ